MNEQNIGIVGLIVIAAIAYIVISWVIARKAYKCLVRKVCYKDGDSQRPTCVIYERPLGKFVVIMILFPLAYIMYALMVDK